jgi:lipopolysaccharide/colanic/teichoic acid biosynthesis glycosyltransferase
MSTFHQDRVSLSERPLIENTDSQPFDNWYSAGGKRIFDVLTSAVALMLLAPLFFLISALVGLTSPGPVLFRQQRVGRLGRTFEILKFRSMRDDPGKGGPLVTSAGDSRVTRVGAVLRRTKFDELPQFWNVLCGDMSLVGPRPEVPYYVTRYTTEQQAVLRVRPGITDAASIQYRFEEQLLGQQSDPGDFYVRVLMQAKLDINLQYLSKISFSHDILIILRTIWATFGSSRPFLA